MDHTASTSLALALSVSLSSAVASAAAPQTTPQPAPEPNFQIASKWWADLWAFWTPIGWKDHLYRFNVLWNGAILAKPDMNRRSGGQGLQLSLTPDYEEWVQKFKADTLRQDDHQVRQGWNEDEAPVLWSEWSKNGWRIRSEAFAHIPGGGDVQTGNEPLFLWLRLRVLDPGKTLPAEQGQDFELILHRMVERYLNIFLEEQGTVKPPGPAYEPRPGYFSTPAQYKSIDWLSDNGAVLYTLATHALLSGDWEFIARSTEGLVRSCEWIAESRRKKNHGGYEGVLPPAVGTDNRGVIRGVWSIGWNYKGLCAAARVLEQIKHPRAAEFAREAVAYKEDFVKALRDKRSKAPVWRDEEGNSHALAPTSLAGEEETETQRAFYLDCGPLFLVFAGLLDGRDPMMQDTCAYFRSGPNHPAYRDDTDCWQRPVLEHEMSSCEPCYSWNVFLSWQLGDRGRFLEGMYSLFAGAVSRQTRISCETRGGITGNVFSAPLAIYLARLSVIDEQLTPGEFHLLRLMPLAWLVPGKAAVIRQVPTEHGPVTVETRLATDGKTLEVVYEPMFRAPPSNVWLHAPPLRDLGVVKVNDKKVWSGGDRLVAIGAASGVKSTPGRNP